MVENDADFRFLDILTKPKAYKTRSFDLLTVTGTSPRWYVPTEASLKSDKIEFSYSKDAHFSETYLRMFQKILRK